MKRLFRFAAVVLVLATAMTSGCAAATEKNGPFAIAVAPTELKGLSMPGQRVVFLVTIDEESGKAGSAVTISAVAEGAEVVVENKDIKEGRVAEVTVIPAAASAGKTLSVTVKGVRGAETHEKTVSFEVIEWTDDRKAFAEEMRGKFVAWLEKEHPELGIKASTAWTGTIVSPQWLIVGHYLFFSPEWEMHIAWHVMIAPDDWCRIDLRHRFDATMPSKAFEISSMDGDTTPKAIDVPTELWR